MSDLGPVKLVLFFTRRISLHTWDEVGMFEREVAIYRRLQDHGVEVSFVTYGDAGDLQYADRIPGINILCNRWRLPLRWYERLLPLLHTWHLWRADVYKTNQTNGADVALSAARLWRKPLIARCGYMWSMLAKNRADGRQEGEVDQAIALERNVFNSADRVVVTTERMREYAVAEYRLPSSKVRVIPNYVLTDHFRPLPNADKHRHRICFIGRLNQEKNPLGLLVAIRGLDVELMMIGDGPLRGILEEEAKRNGLQVQFLGNQPHHELPCHLNSAALFVLLSPQEGHPKTLVEAMSCGLPVIGTDVPGIRELIEHRQSGFLCGASPAEIRAAIQEVLNDAGLRACMGRNARQFVVEHFALERVVEMELGLLKELVK